VKKFRTVILGTLVVLGLVMIVGPSQAAGEYYAFTAYQSSVGSNIGTIHWDTAHHFSADMTAENATNCNGHVTSVGFHFVYADETTGNSHMYPNLRSGCGASYNYTGLDFNQTKIIDSVFPRVCQVVSGSNTNCHNDPQGFFNPDR
jgi:hypothetical protein